MKKAFCLLSLLLLAACTSVSSDVKPEAYNFMCSNGVVASVRHPSSDRATLVFGGRAFDMYQVEAASGTRFATEQGLKPGTGLIWWSHGNKAMMQEMILDHTADPDAYPLIAECSLL